MTFIPLSVVVRLPEVKKYLNRDGLDEYNSLLPHSSGEMQNYVNDWLDAHPEATTTVQDGAISEQKLADESVSLRTLADDTVHMLKGMMLTKEISGAMVAAGDAYSAPPVELTVEGKSTQDGTPTPENPVPIEILEVPNLVVHASADGTTDYGNWPISIPLQGHTLRSLPNGTKDTLALSYLRPSTREGYAWYSRELTTMVGRYEVTAFTNLRNNTSGNQIAQATIPENERVYHEIYTGAGDALRGMSNRFTAAQRATNYLKKSDFNYYQRRGELTFCFELGTFADLAAANAWLTENPLYVLMQLTTPTTETLSPIELPIMPAPNFTIWNDQNTGMQLEYVRDSNIVIQRIEDALG